jgi:hypothetical protein
VVVAWVGGGWHGGNVESALRHELARHELARLAPRAITMHTPTMTLQTCLQACSLKRSYVSCSRVKRNACKRVTKSTQIRNIICDTIFFPAASGR